MFSSNDSNSNASNNNDSNLEIKQTKNVDLESGLKVLNYLNQILIEEKNQNTKKDNKNEEIQEVVSDQKSASESKKSLERERCCRC